MTDPRPEQPDDAAPGAPAVVADDAQLERRVARGIAAWLAVSVILFWVAVSGILIGTVGGSAGIARVSYFLLFAALVVSLILYLSVLLETTAFADRRVQFWLGLSFANLIVLSILTLLATLFSEVSSTGFTPLALIPLLLMAGSVVVLLVSFRTNRRALFVFALAILLVANLVWLMLTTMI